MKDILLLIHDDAGQEARLQCALDIVRAVEGHLQCADVSLMPVPADCSYEGLGDAILLEAECSRETANKAKLAQRLEHEDVPWSWVDMAGDFARCLEDVATLADLIIVNRKLDSFPYPDMQKLAGDVLLRTDKPILAVPDNIRRFPVDGRALVAWDGSPQATAALRAAIPLLRFASEVTLLEIDDGSVDLPAEQAAEYLSHHDIHPRIVRDFALGNPIATVLLTCVKIQQADYVVMGAYSHLRSTETLFGGATRRMLGESPVPVFLTH